MAYTLPIFNLTSRVSTSGDTPNNGPTWTSTLMCQKYIYNRREPDPAWTTYWGQCVPSFRFEPIAFYNDFTRGNRPFWNLGYIECPESSGQYYRVTTWEIMHEGFSNEYPVVWAFAVDGDGVAIVAGSASDTGYAVGTPPRLFGQWP